MPIPYDKLTYNDILHHQAAYECFDKAGKELFPEWNIIGFEKAVLVTVCDISDVFPVGVLPFCPNAVPAPESRRSVSFVLVRSYLGVTSPKNISHSAGHSVVTDFWATKKPVHKRIPT